MIQFDRMSETSADDTDISGAGWLAGPYASGRISSDLYFSVKAAVGMSRNDAQIDIFDDGLSYSGEFNTNRSQVRSAVYGIHALDSGIVLMPKIEVSYMREEQQSYVVSNGMTEVDVPGATVDLGRMSLSLMTEMPNASGDYIAFAEPVIDWNYTGSDVATDEELRASLSLGLKTGLDAGWDASVALRFDGIGSDTLSGHSIDLTLSHVF